MRVEAIAVQIQKFESDQRYLDEEVIATSKYPDGTWVAIRDKTDLCTDTSDEHDTLLDKLNALGFHDKTGILIHRMGAPRSLVSNEAV